MSLISRLSDAFIAVGNDMAEALDRGGPTNLAELKAYTGSYPVGFVIQTRSEGYSFEVVTTGADFTTAGGVKLRLLPKGDGSDLNALGVDVTGGKDMSALLTRYLARVPGIVVKLPGGTVRLDNTVTVPSYVSLDLNNTVFDLTNLAAGQPAFKAAGTVAATKTILSGSGVGSTSVVLADAVGIAPGTVLKFRSTEVFDPGRTNSTFGELARVKSVDTGTNRITLHSPLRDVYRTANNARVEVLAPVRNVNIYGPAEFLGGNANNRKAIHLEKAIDCTIQNIIFKNFHDRALWLQDCDNANGLNLTFEDFNAPGTGYGVSCIDATQNCTFRGIHGRRVRHLFATNNTSAGGGIPRDITVDGFTVDASAYAYNGEGGTEGTGGDAMDTHAASENITFRNGTIAGSTSIGIIMEGAGGTIENVRIVRPAVHGVYAANFSGRPGRIRIDGVTVENPGLNGIRVSANGFGFTGVDVLGCKIIKANAGYAIFLGGTALRYTAVNIDATIVDCDFDWPVFLNNISTGRVSVNLLQNGLARSGVRLIDCIGVTLDVTAEGGFATGNAAIRVERTASGASRNILVRPNIRSSTGQGTGVLVVGAVGNAVIATDRIIDNFATAISVT